MAATTPNGAADDVLELERVAVRARRTGSLCRLVLT